MLWALLNLAAGIAILAIYLWVLTRVAHGGRGWPKRRNRRSSPHASTDHPAEDVDERHHANVR
ncbi:MAG TPA: hypothetical protein VJT31_17550 [Rugosimonospora sp.]|nr:hypothetical protein [Rugosimonospora sp.]